MTDLADGTSLSNRRAVARAAGIIALGNVLSRVLGLARDSTISHFFAASGLASAFTLAQQIPQLIYDLLVGGHISAALVPVLSEYADRDKRDELWRIASGFFCLVTIALAIVVLILEAAAPWVIALTGGGWPPELQHTATTLLRLIAPALFFMGLAGAVIGLLYALRRFTYPAFATAVFNAGIVVAILVGHRYLDIASAAFGVLLGAALQVVLLAPGLTDARLRFHLHFAHPAIRRILRLYLPVLFGVALGIAQSFLDRRLASNTGESSIAWMRYATTLFQTALGLIAAAVSLAVLPALSRADADSDEARYQDTLGLGLRLIVSLVVPATVGLYAMGRPIVALLFEHGASTPRDTTMVTWALYLYLLSLPFTAIDQLLIFAFYARKDTIRPNLVQAFAVGIYLLFALPFVGEWGMFALVIANSAMWIGHTLLMLLLLRRYIGWPHGQRVRATLLRSLVAATAMGGASWGTTEVVIRAFGESTLAARLLTVGAGLTVALGVYLGLAVLLHLEEVRVAWEALRARLGGRQR